MQTLDEFKEGDALHQEALRQAFKIPLMGLNHKVKARVFSALPTSLGASAMILINCGDINSWEEDGELYCEGKFEDGSGFYLETDDNRVICNFHCTAYLQLTDGHLVIAARTEAKKGPLFVKHP